MSTAPVVNYVKAKQQLEDSRAHRVGLGAFAAPLSIVAFVYTALVCALWPPPLPVGSLVFSREARCVALRRYADHVVVLVAMGSPPKRLKVLLEARPRGPAFGDDAERPALLLWSPRLIDSATIACDARRFCTDVALATDGGPEQPQRRFVTRFEYFAAAYAEPISDEAYRLGLDGVLRLSEGKAYSLLTGHLCVEPARAAPGFGDTVARVALRTNGSRELYARASALRAAGAPFASTPAARDCADDGALVELFPRRAAIEQRWLHAQKRDYENGHAAVEQRRETVERAGCAHDSANVSLAHATLDFMLGVSCSAEGNCRAAPSVPLRRAAAALVQLRVGAGGNASVQAEATSTLTWLPKLVDRDEDIVGGVLRVVLLALTALVIFVRSATSPSAYVLFQSCCDTLDAHFERPAQRTDAKEDRGARRLEELVRRSFGYNSFVYRLLYAFFPNTTRPDDPSLSEKLESCVLGLLAACVRLITSTMQYGLLRDDGNERVAVSELAVSTLSLLMWALRWFATDSQHDRIMILGGSTAITDAAAAVIVCFMEPPLRASTNTFAAIARLLTAVILVFTSLVRICFATACCWTLADGILLGRARFDGLGGLERYATTLYAVGMMWMLQGVALAVLVSDAFVTPATDSFAWRGIGPLWPTRALLTLFFTSLALPKLTYSSVKVATGERK